MKALKQFTASFLAATMVASPALAVPGELTVPLTGAQVLFQVFDNPGGGIPSGPPSLNLRNVRSSQPFIDATVGGMQIRYFDIERAIEEAMDGAATTQGDVITLTGQPQSRDWIRLVYNLTPSVQFLAQPQTLNITESSPGHLSASFDTIVDVNLHLETNIFGLPVVGDRHAEADVWVQLAVHVALIDVGVWPPDTNDLFNSGNPPTINENHVEITLQQIGGNIELSGLQEPVILSSFVIGFAGIIAAPATFGLSAILTLLAPFIALAAPGAEELLEDYLNGMLSGAISAGITELDTQLRTAVADAGNQINAANDISNDAPGWLAAAEIFNTWLQSTFGTSFAVASRIDNNVVGVGLTIDRDAGPATGTNTVQGRVMFPKFRCEYNDSEYAETTQECDGTTLWSVDYYNINPELVAINTSLIGQNCATIMASSFYTRSYLGSDWNPPNGASPNWQNLTPSITGTNVTQVTENGRTFYACNFTLNNLPSNIILDFGATAGGSLANKIVPRAIGPMMPAELAVDPDDYINRVHMVIRPVRGALVVLDEEGDVVSGRSSIGAPGPQQATLAADCPSYVLPMDGGASGVCSNPGSWESPCGDCY